VTFCDQRGPPYPIRLTTPSNEDISAFLNEALDGSQANPAICRP